MTRRSGTSSFLPARVGWQQQRGNVDTLTPRSLFGPPPGSKVKNEILQMNGHEGISSPHQYTMDHPESGFQTKIFLWRFIFCWRSSCLITWTWDVNHKDRTYDFYSRFDPFLDDSVLHFVTSFLNANLKIALLISPPYSLGSTRDGMTWKSHKNSLRHTTKHHSNVLFRIVMPPVFSFLPSHCLPSFFIFCEWRISFE